MNDIKELLIKIAGKQISIAAQLRDLKTADILWMKLELGRANEALNDALYIFEDEG